MTPAERADLVARYMQAWHANDVSSLVAQLREDASMAMPQWRLHRLRAEARVFMRRKLERHPLSRRLQVRGTRQTARLDEIFTFYRDGLGLPRIDHSRATPATTV